MRLAVTFGISPQSSKIGEHMLASISRSSVSFKEFVGFAAGVFGFIVPAVFAVDIYNGAIKNANTATWLMIWVMDITGLWIVVAEGNRKPWLQIGWVFAATSIMTAILIRGGSWKWGNTEFLSLGLCLLAVALWQILKNGFGKKKEAVIIGLIFQTLATYISVVPQAIDYWKVPAPETWYLWFFSIVSSLMAVYAAEDRRNPVQVFIPWACAALNVSIWILVIR
jgi:hypothetical protein